MQNNEPIPQEFSCGLIVFNAQDEVLLLKHYGGHWAFSKGHIEEGETKEACALRELEEEAGLEATIIGKKSWRSVYKIYLGLYKEVTYFIAKVKGPDTIRIQESEITDAAWFTFDDAYARITHKDNKSILTSAWNYYLSIKS